MTTAEPTKTRACVSPEYQQTLALLMAYEAEARLHAPGGIERRSIERRMADLDARADALLEAARTKPATH